MTYFLAFIGSKYAFSKNVRGDAEAERKHHDSAKEKLHKVWNERNEDRMK